MASEPMAMQPAIARQNRRGVWLYNQLPATASQISLKEATECAAHSTARNAVLVPISQGTEVMMVTEYVSLSIFLSYCVEYRRLVWEPVQSRHAMTLNDSKPRLMWDYMTGGSNRLPDKTGASRKRTLSASFISVIVSLILPGLGGT